MTRTHKWLRCLFAVSLVCAVGTITLGQDKKREKNKAKVYLRVLLPADAKLLIEGQETKQTGKERLFVSPPIEVGRSYVYTLKATWRENDKEVVKQYDVTVKPGEGEVRIDMRTGEVTKPKGDGDKVPDVIFVPTPQAVVEKMLEVANIKKGDVLYDLGCGDGRIPVTAAKKYGIKAWGFDVDPQRIKESLENVKKNNVEKLVTIEKKDIFTLDLSKADVITLYLLPNLNVKLVPQLKKLKPGSRIVSHDFDMKGYKPDEGFPLTMKAKDDEGREDTHYIYRWTTPLKPLKKE
ncbi:MAG: hypothetical protein KatS3mg105_1484 [Gemmatales bacterium]|nr:MAG: hypothetical protein KatS3mg105_1484 [Gemmatales bacterium]